MNKSKRKVEWRNAFESIMIQFRLSGNELSQIAGVRQSTISRIARGDTPNPYPATIRKIEEALNIQFIQEDDRVRFIRSARGRKIIASIKSKDNGVFEPKFPMVEIPFVEEINSMGLNKIMELFEAGETIDRRMIAAVVKDTIAVPYESEEAIAIRITTDKNFPYLIEDDIVVFDLMEEVQNKDLVAVVIDAENKFVARVEDVDDKYYHFYFYNNKYEPRTIEKSKVAMMIKAKKVIRENI